jgi:glycosyltransferase involved in cell wall biosynthesis
VDGSPDEYFFHTDGYSFDWLFGTIPHDKDIYTKHFRSFLLAADPDVVHLHHTLFFGYDLLREIRNSLPSVPIVYTLHEYMPICHRQGQMLRVGTEEACDFESPRRCNECFPEITPQSFFLRKRFVLSHFSVVDQFIAPSAFLRDRYVDWGIPEEKIVVEEYGRTPPAGSAPAGERTFRDRFGFFGQLSHYKGVHVLLEAMKSLSSTGRDTTADDPLLRALELAVLPGSGEPRLEGATPRPHLWVHGANLDLQPGAFQTKVEELLEATRENVTYVGRYDHEQLADYMSNIDWVVVPSLWWENSPLVIQEAFHFGRPVICTNHGGMAEKVIDGINGLHFRAGDAADLARTIERAAGTPGLWEELRAGIPPVHSMESHVVRLSELYRSLLDREVAVA